MKPDDLPETETDSIVIECELSEPREKVWRALTVPEIVAEWLTPEAQPAAAASTPAVHSAPRTKTEALTYEVITADRPHRLQYRLREGHALSVESTVTFELSDTPFGGTRLRIFHEDFALADGGTRQLAVLRALEDAGSRDAHLQPSADPARSSRTIAGAGCESEVVPNSVASVTGSPILLRARRQSRRPLTRRSAKTRMALRSHIAFKAAA